MNVIAAGVRFFLIAASALGDTMRRNQKKPGPCPAPILLPHPIFLRAVRGCGLPVDYLRRAVAHVCSPRTVTTILAGSGKCTPISLTAVGLLAELVGAPHCPRRD